MKGYSTFQAVMLAAALMLCHLLPAGAQVVIPLELGLDDDGTGDSQRLFIYVGINGGPVQKYLFDTGSENFNAAYYIPGDGTYTGTNPNPAVWANTGTLSSGATYTYSDSTTLHFNEVYVPTISIYNPNNLTTAALTLTATSTSPSSLGFQVGQVVSKTIGGNTDASFTAALAAGTAPLKGTYGTFGAGLFAGTNNSGSTPFVDGSVLGQATTTGWVISANGSSAYAILGLNSGIISQFTSTTAWTGTGQPFPNSGANASTEFGGGEFTYTLSGSGNTTVTWANGTLLDTGTPNNSLHATGVTQEQLAPYETNPNQVDAGYEIAASGTLVGSGTYSFTTDSGTLVTYDATVDPGGNSSTMGIGFFLNNSVGFDLQNQQTLYTSNVVTAPEPAGPLLFLLGLMPIGVRALWFRRTRPGLSAQANFSVSTIRGH